MIFLFRYITGYLKIEFSGEISEKFINLAFKNNIKLWNLRYKDFKITAFISIKDFKKLPTIIRKSGVKIHILEKRGLPIIIHRHKKRSGLIIGAVLFMAALYLLNNYVWIINVNGNKTVKEAEILSHCKEIGIYEGVKKTKFNPKSSSQQLLLNFDKLAWSSFNLEGSVLNINVSEIKNPTDESQKSPSNLIATHDGIIKRIDVKSGNVLVKVGDAVSKGDLLVSGIIERMSSTTFVNSVGVIEAECVIDFEAHKKFITEESIKTGEMRKRKNLSIYGVKIPLNFFYPKRKYIKTENEKQLVILEKSLPFIYNEEIYEMTEKRKVEYNKKNLETILKKETEEKIKDSGFDDYILKSEKFYERDEGILFKKSISVITNIAKERKISVNNTEE